LGQFCPHRYAAGGEALIRFDSDTDGGIELIHGADSFEAILADIQADKRLDQDDRCRLGAGLAQYLPNTLDQLGCGA